MNYLNLSEQALNIISSITIAIIFIDIFYSMFTQRGRPDSIRKINIGLILKHLIVIGYLAQGRLIFAGLWIGIIMLAMWTRSLARKHEVFKEDLKKIRAEINVKVIAKMAEDFDLDPKDFAIEETDEHTATIMYKGEVFDASKHELKEE